MTIIDKLTDAQKYAMSIRPKIGGFPIMAEVLREAGVQKNRWFLPSCQSVYLMEEGSVVQQGLPIFSGTYEVPKFNREALITAIRTDQEGQSTFAQFLQSAWNAGVTEYEADFTNRSVIYYGVNGESYSEKYQAVEFKKATD
jgi:uncharacterized protein YbcV (DUF1398 family)